jgi:macrolide transport system ATP-binding/permease protein
MKPGRKPLIEVRGLRRTFVSAGAIETNALDGIDLDIYEGEFVAIRGTSGSGKSTLLNILGCLDRSTSGTYRLAGIDVSRLSLAELARLRQDAFGFIFQRYQLIPGLSAIDNVEMPATYAGMQREARRDRATQLMKLFGLDDQLWKLPWQLSGGQQQRVAIARSLINGGAIILADEPTGALDSKNSAEVISILRELAASGRTVILVTHDVGIAAQADRTIEIADGMIVSDCAQKTEQAPAVAAGHVSQVNPSAQPSLTVPAHVPRSHGARAYWASIVEATRSAFGSMRSNPMRTSLTLLGIVIGVASVVALAAIGRGAETEMFDRLSNTLAHSIMVTNRRAIEKTYMPLTLADAAAIAELPNVVAALPVDEKHGVASYGSRETTVEIIGTTRSYRSVYRWPARLGAYFTEADEKRGAAVAMLGKAVAERLFPDGTDPTGATILVERVPFKVLGVLEEKGSGINGDNYDNCLVVPVHAMMYRIGSMRELQYIVVELADMGLLKSTREAVRALLIERHGKQDFSIADTAAAHRKVKEERMAMNIRLVAIGGISLLVGGIGIMNMMLTAVRERTREIGIRTASGATPGDIMRQFLIEAVVISSTGGLAGLVIGIAISAIAAYLGATVILSITSAAVAFLSAFALGVPFGHMPARHAARLDPVEALASE